MHRRSSASGSVAVELAASLSTLALIGLVVGQTGLFLSEGQRFVQAVFEATRYAAIAPYEPSDAAVRAHLEHVLQEMGMHTEGLQLTVTYAEDLDEETVAIRASLPVTFFAAVVELPSTYEQEFVAVVTRSEP